MDIHGRDLLDLWHEARRRGLTQAQHAAELGVKYTTYEGRMRRALAQQAAAGPVPESRYPKYDTHEQITGDFLIFGDLHIPLHSAEFVNRCIALAQAWGVTNLILGGDALDMRTLSRWPDDVSINPPAINTRAENDLLDLANTLPEKHRRKIYELVHDMVRPAGDLGDEIAESRRALMALSSAFERVYWMMGNHEKRLVAKLEKTLPAADVVALYGGADPKIKVSPYYYMEIESSGVKYRITHPKNSAKGSSKRLVPIHGMHIIQLHNHHYSIQSDPSGQWLGIEPGMCADPQRIDYDMQRDSTHDAHVLGAVMIVDGVPWLLNRWSDWDRLTKLGVNNGKKNQAD